MPTSLDGVQVFRMASLALLLRNSCDLAWLCQSESRVFAATRLGRNCYQDPATTRTRHKDCEDRPDDPRLWVHLADPQHHCGLCSADPAGGVGKRGLATSTVSVAGSVSCNVLCVPCGQRQRWLRQLGNARKHRCSSTEDRAHLDQQHSGLGVATAGRRRRAQRERREWGAPSGEALAAEGSAEQEEGFGSQEVPPHPGHGAADGGMAAHVA
mmetsp:Transcript_37996/g.105730  ORF Transcript_37996/g.105730 Transcript_37996/m.105730 type:complete len:212 (-) Transcript_37996:12-647(-)